MCGLEEYGIRQKRKELGRKVRVIRRQMRHLRVERIALLGKYAGLSVGIAALKLQAYFSRKTNPLPVTVMRFNRRTASSMTTTLPMFRSVITPALQAAG